MKLDRYDEAINLLARYAKQNMPDGYTVILTFSKREVSMQLEGPDGDDIGGDDPPRWFADACEMACEHAQEEGQQ
ncbi:MAG: hypothetical protein ACRCWS_03640 [Propionibacteriaceae bacterium]